MKEKDINAQNNCVVPPPPSITVLLHWLSCFIKKVLKMFIPYGLLYLYHSNLPLNLILPQLKILVKKERKTFIPYGIIHFRWRYVVKHILNKPRRSFTISVHIVEHCNLNCLGCSHYSCLAEESFLDITVFEKDCKRLSQLTNGKLGYLTIMGGEPLLHPQLIDFMRIARTYFYRSQVNILTNAILLLKQKQDFWDACKEYNINIQISRYPIKLDFNKIQEKIIKNGIYLDDFIARINTWAKNSLDIEGKQDPKRAAKQCVQINRCTMLDNGKMYTCSVSGYIRHFNKYFKTNLEVTDDDYIDIYKAVSAKEISNFLCKPIPFCRYCNWEKSIPPGGVNWSTTKKDISEWT